MIHAPAATRKKKGKGREKNSKGQICVLEPKTGKRHLRREWDTVVDGYQAVEHERCFFFVQGVSRPFKSAVVINGFAVRTYELAESIDIGILVDGR
jgi:hypothetical protein